MWPASQTYTLRPSKFVRLAAPVGVCLAKHHPLLFPWPEQCFTALQAFGRPLRRHVIKYIKGGNVIAEPDPGQLRSCEDMGIRREGGGIIQRAHTHEAHRPSAIVTPKGRAAIGAAIDVMRSAALRRHGH